MSLNVFASNNGTDYPNDNNDNDNNNNNNNNDNNDIEEEDSPISSNSQVEAEAVRQQQQQLELYQKETIDSKNSNNSNINIGNIEDEEFNLPNSASLLSLYSSSSLHESHNKTVGKSTDSNNSNTSNNTNTNTNTNTYINNTTNTKDTNKRPRTKSRLPQRLRKVFRRSPFRLRRNRNNNVTTDTNSNIGTSTGGTYRNTNTNTNTNINTNPSRTNEEVVEEGIEIESSLLIPSTSNQNHNNNHSHKHNTNTSTTKGLVSSSDHSNYSSCSVLIHDTKQTSALSSQQPIPTPRSESPSDQLEDRKVLLENIFQSILDSDQEEEDDDDDDFSHSNSNSNSNSSCHHHNFSDDENISHDSSGIYSFQHSNSHSHSHSHSHNHSNNNRARTRNTRTITPNHQMIDKSDSFTIDNHPNHHNYHNNHHNYSDEDLSLETDDDNDNDNDSNHDHEHIYEGETDYEEEHGHGDNNNNNNNSENEKRQNIQTSNINTMGRNNGIELTNSSPTRSISSNHSAISNSSMRGGTTTTMGSSTTSLGASNSGGTTGKNSNLNCCQSILSKCIYHNPICKCALSISTISDYLPSIPSDIIQNSKMSFLILFASCVVLNLFIIVPGYLFSYVVTEVGVYICNLFGIWCLGRFVVRLIAFPGSTMRVSSEIENEFTKYSLRMIQNSAEHIIEFCTLVISFEEALLYTTSNSGSGGIGLDTFGSPKKGAVGLLGRGGLNGDNGHYEVVSTWRKIEQYRNRVLGMFFDVLHCLIHENGQGSAVSSSTSGTGDELLNKYSNNRIVGDIGNLLSSVTKEGREDGEVLYMILKRVLIDFDHLENCASDYLNANTNHSSPLISLEAIRAAQKLLISVTELNDLIPSLSLLKHASHSTVQHTEDHPVDHSHGRARLVNNSIVSSVFSVLESVVSLFDPPPHKSILGLDVLRGAMLSRYVGARQLWFPRPKADGGGMIDVIHIPSKATGTNSRRVEKAVLFCNPNAGLIEVSTGISLIGGNVAYSGNAASSWTDFYIENGYDIFLFNYSGFGRSYTGKERILKEKSFNPCLVLGRIIYNSFFGFKPSPSTLKADALAVATHMLKEFSIDNMVIHGESIGGMAAASAAQKLSKMKHVDEVTSLPKAYPTLLLCDRTFCNLNAVASRLVGSWTSAVIPLLTPLWNTDVAADFIAATCKKVVAQDAADAIIHFSSSLQRGVATAKELKKGSTKGLADVVETPLHYRMSDFENVGVLESQYVKPTKPYRQLQVPVWPADKHLDLREAFHFAACTRRIGKVATSIRREILFNACQGSMTYDDEEEGIEITTLFSRDSADQENQQLQSEEKDNIILEVWETLARCDGLTGFPLGAAVKEGDDCVIDWLSCLTIFGCQRVSLNAEKRNKDQAELVVRPVDFEMEVIRNEQDEETRLPPLPLPGVITLLSQFFQDKDNIKKIEKELDYCIKMLEYVMSRITSKNSVKNMIDVSHFRDSFDGVTTGRFLNLNCGHNNQYLLKEKYQLLQIMTEACDTSNGLA